MIRPLIVGFATTLKHIFRKPITVNYPAQKVPVFPKYRGKQVLMRDENDLEKCVACGLCCRACPEKALTLRRSLDPTRLQGSATLLEEEMARCRRCGVAFAPLKMCEKIRDLLARSGIPRPEYVINLCPSCRVVGGRPSALQDPCGLEHPRTRNEPVLEFSAREAGA